MNAPIATRPTTSTRGVVLYDGNCPLCQRSVAVLRRLDWLKRLAYHDANDTAHLPTSPVPLQPTQLLEQMHVVPVRGKQVYAGFYAFRWIAWQLPLLWAIAPMFYLPGVPTLGQKVYLWVAKNRLKLVPCKDGVCELPPAQKK
jgi:predicted DCC family thiol-disulfide oxidoreductase YuxK